MEKFTLVEFVNGKSEVRGECNSRADASAWIGEMEDEPNAAIVADMSNGGKIVYANEAFRRI